MTCAVLLLCSVVALTSTATTTLAADSGYTTNQQPPTSHCCLPIALAKQPLFPNHPLFGLGLGIILDLCFVFAVTRITLLLLFTILGIIMAANRNRRLVKEIQDVQKDTHSGVSLESMNKAQSGSDTLDDLTHFKGVFRGPPDTPYHGATYNVDIKIPPDYPFQPPIMKFMTKIWHPNVSSVTVSLVTCDPFRFLILI